MSYRTAPTYTDHISSFRAPIARLRTANRERLVNQKRILTTPRMSSHYLDVLEHLSQCCSVEQNIASLHQYFIQNSCGVSDEDNSTVCQVLLTLLCSGNQSQYTLSKCMDILTHFANLASFVIDANTIPTDCTIITGVVRCSFAQNAELRKAALKLVKRAITTFLSPCLLTKFVLPNLVNVAEVYANDKSTVSLVAENFVSAVSSYEFSFDNYSNFVETFITKDLVNKEFVRCLSVLVKQHNSQKYLLTNDIFMKSVICILKTREDVFLDVIDLLIEISLTQKFSSKLLDEKYIGEIVKNFQSRVVGGYNIIGFFELFVNLLNNGNYVVERLEKFGLYTFVFNALDMIYAKDLDGLVNFVNSTLLWATDKQKIVLCCEPIFWMYANYLKESFIRENPTVQTLNRLKTLFSMSERKRNILDFYYLTGLEQVVTTLMLNSCRQIACSAEDIDEMIRKTMCFDLVDL
ncbi:hypothetical protein EIN_172810 [Entamoeba invadens IP1]|uniref:Uncharacterized protein n=1 Tax=Entamoeba invadens IP1 TaxID=370355 RepID=A0A0A1TW02_ENTIV|nr:hypothetical protein EIN_172810 [Entamoeba invadens IP1]ELP84636.1 hypothetical protein EIN_172810 [Entamoeba invadens IP1]|eukprot:XP_004183982.1 hypothetical protein EIN_172810 [Entamoeba invadens IP1]